MEKTSIFGEIINEGMNLTGRSMEEKITLYELQERVRECLASGLERYYWIKAEIGEIKANLSGHRYLELTDYDVGKGGLVAKVKATMWSRTAAMLVPFFETTTGSPLAAGMRVLLKVQVQYSPLYGLSLNITDIDPSFTVGELEIERQRIINRLEKEGMFGLNSQLAVPLLPNRIAVVSSENAAGYRDFMKHLSQNDIGTGFYTKLYPSPMQGEEAPGGIISALEQIAEDLSDGEQFDLVAIVRGGGAALELACFNNYELALNIAQFPLPVLTGIGHDHDLHIADMVAHSFFKTPTAVADYIISLYMEQYGVVEELSLRLRNGLKRRFDARHNYLDSCMERVANGVKRIIRERENRLDMLELKLNAHNPLAVLSRGYAIAVKEGKRVTSVKDMLPGDTFKLIMADGTAELALIAVKPSGEKKRGEGV